MSELSPESRALFEAARRDAVPTDADRARIQRSLSAMIGLPLPTPTRLAAPGHLATPAIAKGVVVAVLAAAGAAGVFWARPQVPAISRAPVVHAAPAEPAAPPAPQAAPQPAAVSSPTPVDETAPAAAPATPVRAARVQPAQRPSPVFAPMDLREPALLHETAPAAAQDSLAEELRLIRQAQLQLRAGDAAGALGLLDEHARRFSLGSLREERAAVRVQALCALGRVDEARDERQRFLAESPESPYAGRVRSSCAGQR